MLAHGHLPSCQDCQKWVYNIETGEQYERGGKPVERKPGQATPCRICPKGSPENEARNELNRKNLQTVALYLRNRALFGRALTDREAADPIIQRNFSIVESIYRAHENTQSGRRLSEAVAMLVAAPKHDRTRSPISNKSR